MNHKISMVQIADALHQLRDSLVEVSMELQDFQFDLESADLSPTIALLQELIEKSKKDFEC